MLCHNELNFAHRNIHRLVLFITYSKSKPVLKYLLYNTGQNPVCVKLHHRNCWHNQMKDFPMAKGALEDVGN